MSQAMEDKDKSEVEQPVTQNTGLDEQPDATSPSKAPSDQLRNSSAGLGGLSAWAMALKKA